MRRSRSRDLHNSVFVAEGGAVLHNSFFNVLMRGVEARKEAEMTAVLNTVMWNDI